MEAQAQSSWSIMGLRGANAPDTALTAHGALSGTAPHGSCHNRNTRGTIYIRMTEKTPFAVTVPRLTTPALSSRHFINLSERAYGASFVSHRHITLHSRMFDLR
ncbi:unnamed protein product [Pleuronectes platessa]|uniref:Uncharacterized protein n=1 Tax=Pleuronectes platessa TaxID=8262 RepID=A0A9N7VS96_PLEPL|nr:unnamed protein product [Pleuronectes platessa]